MINFTEQVSPETPSNHLVALTYHQRIKGRLRIVTKDGLEAGVVTIRGDELTHGVKLSDGEGRVLEITAQPEPVSVATTDNPLLFARACYHVGNRHAEVQIETGRLVYLSDHVLDSMLERLGLSVSSEILPFSPENGAYSGMHSHGELTGTHEH